MQKQTLSKRMKSNLDLKNVGKITKGNFQNCPWLCCNDTMTRKTGRSTIHSRSTGLPRLQGPIGTTGVMTAGGHEDES